MRPYPFINSLPFWDYGPLTFDEHLRSIKNHTARVRYANKKRKEEKKALFTPPKIPKYVSFRILPSGKGSITIRKRKEAFIYESELSKLKEDFPDNQKEIHEAIAKRKISIKPDPGPSPGRNNDIGGRGE